MGAGLAVTTFSTFSRLSGLVPLVGVASGYCFAGNAAFLGVCDVIIATQGCNIGMGGPAMIEGGGLGVVKATDIGPLPEQVSVRSACTSCVQLSVCAVRMHVHVCDSSN